MAKERKHRLSWYESYLYINLPNPSSPGVYSASNRNEYQKQKNNVSGECGRCVMLTTSSPSVSQLSTQCGILSISQPCRTPRPVTGIALLFPLLLVNVIQHFPINIVHAVVVFYNCMCIILQVESRRNESALYSGGIRFESLPGLWLSRLIMFMVFRTTSRVVP
jgi:hypothetical protein